MISLIYVAEKLEINGLDRPASLEVGTSSPPYSPFNPSSGSILGYLLLASLLGFLGILIN